MDKVIRNGKVAVLYSPGFGAGWYTWHHNLELVFHPAIVAMVEQGREDEINEEWMVENLGMNEDDVPYLGGAEDLTIAWLDEGTSFKINEYDGSESIQERESVNWIHA
jgi:hypothetical protein